eukprot:TRINITY_DN10997_c0_g1_i1.p1 TRINITY_DN10997_c0_g1~~TRINITY_DN10997_c0_g1_i1.p1  ORF type:complete len:501 (+),score=96.96 TRINITY_DN10997_c0_g1_i1:427-1929(+)
MGGLGGLPGVGDPGGLGALGGTLGLAGVNPLDQSNPALLGQLGLGLGAVPGLDSLQALNGLAAGGAAALYGAQRGLGSAARLGPYGLGAGAPQVATHANVFVGNLKPNTTEADLVAAFSVCGNVLSTKLHQHPQTGASRRSGFVRFSTPEEAQHAILTLDGQNGMSVKPANSDMVSLGKNQTGGSNLYVNGLPTSSTTPESLKSTFTEAGFTVVRSRLIPDNKGTGLAAGMVELADAEQAARAIQLLNGKGMTVSYAIDRGPAGKGAGKGAGKVSNGGSSGPPCLVVKYAGGYQTPSDNLYIAGLPAPEVDKRSLKQIFEQNGLTVVRMRNMPASPPKESSVAMVQVGSVAEASFAIQKLHGQSPAALGLEASTGQQPDLEFGKGAFSKGTPPVELQGQQPAASEKPLTASFAGQAQVPSDRVYIGGLPSPEVDPIALQQMFTSWGYVCTDITTIADNWGFGSAATVQFASQQHAQNIIDQLNGKTLTELGAVLWTKQNP